MSEASVHLYTICWDEADMLGFFFRHYDPWVTRYVIYDDGSTDGTREILKAHPKVELRDFQHVDPDSFILSHRTMQESCWKESRGKADWVVMTAIDEHLHIPGRAMRDYLMEQKKRGVTFIPALGFDMNAPEFPSDDGLLVERVTRGRPRIAFNKLGIFDPEAMDETGYAVGRHSAEPQGRLVLPQQDDLMLWHYKHLGFERNFVREKTQSLRLGKTDVERQYGKQYFMPREELRAFWDQMEATSSDLSVEDFDPRERAIKPLWWCNSPAISRTLQRRKGVDADASRQVPKVSVLIKCYNHAPYIRQSIESILSQSFQDFEIVITDDGSTDDTADILRSFDDPRINLQSLPKNIGISGAMNATIARARGNYLAILNSDDFAFPNRLQAQVDFLDSNEGVSAVFSSAQLVNETGDLITDASPFDLPDPLKDWSRKSWLRFFFFERNVLCAPSAMIRRDVYESVGVYDRRLTNLQDFDMWTRMLLAGHKIQVLPETLTCFRIRDNQANASADKLETHLRSNFEMSKILRHYADLTEDDFEEIFGENAVATRGLSVKKRLAHLALEHSSFAYRSFALTAFYDAAASDDDYNHLKALSGSLDIFGIERAYALKATYEELHGERAKNENLARLLHDAEHQKQAMAAAFEAQNARSQAEISYLQALLKRSALARLRDWLLGR